MDNSQLDLEVLKKEIKGMGYGPLGDDVLEVISRLEKAEAEAAAMREALSGRTVSCSACNAMGKELAELRSRVKELEPKP